MQPAPIKLTSEAEAFLRRALPEPKSDFEPALVWSPGGYTNDQKGRVLGVHEEPRVILGWYKKGQRPKDSFFDVCGYAVSIMSSSLEHIEGKTISYEKIEIIFEAGPHHEYILKVG